MSNQPDWQDIVEQAKDVERMRLLREQNDALQEMSGRKTSDDKMPWGWMLLFFLLGLPVVFWVMSLR